MKAYLDRLTDRKMNKGGKFLNKLRRCIGWGEEGGDLYLEIYQLMYRALALRQSK